MKVAQGKNYEQKTIDLPTDRRFTNNITSFLKNQREQALLCILRTMEDKVKTRKNFLTIKFRFHLDIWWNNWTQQLCVTDELASTTTIDFIECFETRRKLPRSSQCHAGKNKICIYEFKWLVSFSLDKTFWNTSNINTRFIECGSCLCQSGTLELSLFFHLYGFLIDYPL